MNLYRRPGLLFNAHLETIFPSLFRKVEGLSYRRERIKTSDDDFLDLDWVENQNKKLVIISHGLEGNSHRAYVKGIARAFHQAGYDALCWNFRGCSDDMNLQLRFYHSGATDDLDFVVQHAISRGQYHAIYLVGFSLGGNLTLKYLGERGNTIAPELKACVTFSVPLDLHTSSMQISKPSNWIYSRRFLKALKRKVIEKSLAKNEINISGIEKINILIDFDDRFTAPIHGFASAVEYYRQCSALHFVDAITIPTLIVNAKNDPFLSKECYPTEQLAHHPFVTFESPEHGGHVGFTLFNQNGLYWSEVRALNFIQSIS
jgi:predicted alpha/beta-fold hydrolase